jgi:ribonuclease Z
MIDLLLIGTGGMLPLPNRWLSSLLVRCGGDLILFDCGEGTQIPWRRFGWGFRRLAAICFSHTHADHVAGLPGLLHSLANAGRTEPVAIVGPVGTASVVAGLRVIAPVLPYEVRVQELASGERFVLPGGLRGSVLAGEHGLPCLAYRADLDRARRFDPERARLRGVPLPLWRTLQRGQAVTWAGEGSATPDDVLGPPRAGLSIAYVTDTRPVAGLPAFLRGVDLLVCEGTYGDSADLPKAIERGHMTFREAATLAREAEVGALWLTHFSPALEDPPVYLPEATAVFPATTIGRSGLTTTLSFSDEES